MTDRPVTEGPVSEGPVSDGPLAGQRIVTTREHPGLLDEQLMALGAEVVHVPLIEIVPPIDDGTALASALGAAPGPDWVVVTSRHGAAAVGAYPPTAVRTAAVGARTAAVWERAWGRPVDLVPAVQHASALLAAFESHREARPPCRVLVAQADRAEPTLVDGLIGLGHEVEVVTAYRTLTRRPDSSAAEAVVTADAVTFASGSAAEAWAEAFGTATPPVVCAIGPSTARVAREHGLAVTHVAEQHSVDGLVDAVVAALTG